MILQFSWAQLCALQAPSVWSGRHEETTRKQRIRDNCYEIALPPAAWRALVPALTDQAVNRYGQWTSRNPGAREALRKVVAGLQRYERHPALRGEVAIFDSDQPEYLVVFDRNKVNPRWSPYPDHSRSLRVLLPTKVDAVEVDLGGGKVLMPGVAWMTVFPEVLPYPIGNNLFTNVKDHLDWD